MSLWGGRFAEGLDPVFEAFNRSLPFDRRMWREDLEGSRAWAAALVEAGVLRPAEGRRLDRALVEIERDLDRDERGLSRSKAEDIHSYVEERLIRLVGDLGKKLHTGRSRNDQVATDLRLWLRRRLPGCDEALRLLQKRLAELAEREAATPIPGYTHLQRAQVVTAGHHALAYVEMIARDRERLRNALDRIDDSCPLGSGALAGTGFPVDRRALARRLGFRRPSRNSLDAVSDRDFVAEVLFVATLSGLHLSRLAEDWIFYASAEAGFLVLSDAVTTGSSLMPQKKNPDSLELIRGKSARILGRMTGFLACLRSLPLAYDKDLQEDKEALFEGLDTWEACTRVMATVVEGARFDLERCRAGIRKGFLNATDLADRMVEAGVPFREAHERCGRLVRFAQGKGLELHELGKRDLAKADPDLDPSILKDLDPEQVFRRRKALGAARPASVLREARRWLRRLAGEGPGRPPRGSAAKRSRP